MTFSYFHAMIVLQVGGRMQFGFLNLTGFLIVALMMIPNLIYALRNPHIENKCFCKPMLIVEQIGRYGSMAMMVFPLFVWEFGFKSPEELVIWLFLLLALLLAYFVLWAIYFRRPSLPAALWLAILPSAIFILRGVIFRHWLLTAFGVIFAVGHIYITWDNNRSEGTGNEQI